MPSLSVLIKPSSSHCNMSCSYCFYEDIAATRKDGARDFMTEKTAKMIIKKAFEYSTISCTFSFQGGEPTLIGIEFFESFVALVKKYNTKQLPVNYSVQTNGYLIDQQWSEFFHMNHFLVGVSLDGTKEIHDSFRPDSSQKGTFTKVLSATKLLENNQVEFNILTVVTKQLAKSIGKVYSFYRRNKFFYQQYIPCLEPIGASTKDNPHLLSPVEYGEFLIDLFQLWYLDRKSGKEISIRYFDNLLGILKGYPPESCDMSGRCTIQNVIESDGSVYPCDFYAMDQFFLGNINLMSFKAINSSEKAKAFTAETNTHSDCNSCKWLPVCRGGCRRHYEPNKGFDQKNYYCESYKMFFEYCFIRLREIANTI